MIHTDGTPTIASGVNIPIKVVERIPLDPPRGNPPDLVGAILQSRERAVIERAERRVVETAVAFIASENVFTRRALKGAVTELNNFVEAFAA